MTIHDDVIKWKHFPRNWLFVRKIHRSPVSFPHKGQWRGALMFSLIYAWINDWANNREAGDLRRQHGHYDVIIMHLWGNWVVQCLVVILHWVVLELVVQAILEGDYWWSIYNFFRELVPPIGYSLGKKRSAWYWYMYGSFLPSFDVLLSGHFVPGAGYWSLCRQFYLGTYTHLSCPLAGVGTRVLVGLALGYHGEVRVRVSKCKKILFIFGTL